MPGIDAYQLYRAYRQGQQDSLNEAQAFQNYETQGLKDLYMREQMPIQLVADRSDLVRKFMPINEERLSQADTGMGTQLLNQAINQVLPQPFGIEKLQPRMPQGGPSFVDPVKQADVDQRRADMGKNTVVGSPGNAISSMSSPELEKLLQNDNLRLRIYDEKYLSRLSPTDLDKLSEHAITDNELQLMVNEYAKRGIRDPWADNEGDSYGVERPAQRSPQGYPQQRGNLSTASLMQMASQVDPMKDYMGETEMKLRKNLEDRDVERAKAALSTLTSLEKERLDNKGKKTKEVDEAKKEVDSEYKAFLPTIRKYLSLPTYEKNQMTFESMVLPLYEAASPQNQAKLQKMFKKELSDLGAITPPKPPQNKKELAQSQGVEKSDKYFNTSALGIPSHRRGNWQWIANKGSDYLKGMIRSGSKIPKSEFDKFVGALKENGAPPGEIGIYESLFRKNLE